MTRIALVLSLLSSPGLAADLDLKSVLKGVEAHYNRAKTLQVAFNETYTGQGRPRQNESGQLILRKPGRMRWDYSFPPGKLYLSDGKQVYLYTPDLNRVEHMPLKDTDDMRAPLAFLLGKLDFNREFRDFQIKPDGVNAIVLATAKSDKLPYDRIEMHVTPAFVIQKLVVNGLDRSVLTFEFDQEKINLPVENGRFQFRMPAGASLVNGETVQ